MSSLHGRRLASSAKPLAMDKAGGSGDGEVDRRVPHQIMQGYLRAPGSHHLHRCFSALLCSAYSPFLKFGNFPRFIWWMSLDGQGWGGIGSGWWWTPRGEASRSEWSPSSRWLSWRCRKRRSLRSGSQRLILTWVFPNFIIFLQSMYDVPLCSI